MTRLPDKWFLLYICGNVRMNCTCSLNFEFEDSWNFEDKKKKKTPYEYRLQSWKSI